MKSIYAPLSMCVLTGERMPRFGDDPRRVVQRQVETWTWKAEAARDALERDPDNVELRYQYDDAVATLIAWLWVRKFTPEWVYKAQPTKEVEPTPLSNPTL